MRQAGGYGGSHDGTRLACRRCGEDRVELTRRGYCGWCELLQAGDEGRRAEMTLPVWKRGR
jgi:ribosomal protein L37E